MENENKRLTLTFSGRAQHTYQFTIAGPDNITRLQGRSSTAVELI